MEDLEDAAKLLRVALDHYLDVCLKIHSLVARKGTLRNIPQKFLRHINTEMDRFPSYEHKLRQAGAAVCRVRNRLPRLAPVILLPPEILTRIFQFVASPCDILRTPDDEDSESETPESPSEVSDAGVSVEGPRSKALQLKNFPSHLDRVTHVCSSWRWIAIGTPSLWTHIDFIPNRSLHRKLLARAETYATRAARLSIELHVADDDPPTYNWVKLRQFLSSILHRIKLLDIVMIHRWCRFHTSILDELFPHPAPESTVLTKLTGSFPMADDELDEFIDWLDDANESLFRLTVLHLHGIFPLWDSTAYYNLVDLRLIAPCDARWTCISESQLQSMLAASPGLRIFYFALQIIDRKPDEESVTPVRLNDLQVLHISTNRGMEDTILRPGNVLRLLAPGSTPLRVSIWHRHCASTGENTRFYCEYDEFSLDELVKFFQRSNITKFCAKDICPRLDKLLCHTSNLEDLVLDYSVSIWKGMTPFQRDGPATFHLNSLILHDCTPNLEQLELLLQQYPTNLLVASNCNWSEITINDERDCVAQLHRLLMHYPNTRLVVNEGQLSDPIASWDLID
ncbi:hypothetical protein B0J17DRAFT_719611 [Rhizoctonia solani]|nr:hypothetical protein B0J17DRAFT_719611 [Rhizoctonia solani]